MTKQGEFFLNVGQFNNSFRFEDRMFGARLWYDAIAIERSTLGAKQSSHSSFRRFCRFLLKDCLIFYLVFFFWCITWLVMYTYRIIYKTTCTLRYVRMYETDQPSCCRLIDLGWDHLHELTASATRYLQASEGYFSVHRTLSVHLTAMSSTRSASSVPNETVIHLLEWYLILFYDHSSSVRFCRRREARKNSVICMARTTRQVPRSSSGWSIPVVVSCARSLLESIASKNSSSIKVLELVGCILILTLRMIILNGC